MAVIIPRAVEPSLPPRTPVSISIHSPFPLVPSSPRWLPLHILSPWLCCCWAFHVGGTLQRGVFCDCGSLSEMGELLQEACPREPLGTSVYWSPGTLLATGSQTIERPSKPSCPNEMLEWVRSGPWMEQTPSFYYLGAPGSVGRGLRTA